MKINTKIRIKCVKRILKRINIEHRRREANPYGVQDSYETYCLIEYWEDVLKKLNSTY